MKCTVDSKVAPFECSNLFKLHKISGMGLLQSCGNLLFCRSNRESYKQMPLLILYGNWRKILNHFDWEERQVQFFFIMLRPRLLFPVCLCYVSLYWFTDTWYGGIDCWPPLLTPFMTESLASSGSVQVLCAPDVVNR